MAARHQRTAEGVLRGDASSRRRRNAYPRRRTLTPAPPRARGGLARRRASEDGRAEVLPSNLPATTTLKTLAAAIKARWLCEQAHQQLKEELGLDHFEGRSWSGLHRHALMSMVAFLYLQHRRIRAAKRGKKDERPTASAQPSGRTHGNDRPHPPAPLSTMSLPVQTADRATQL